MGATSLFVLIGFVMAVGRFQQAGNIAYGSVMDWNSWQCMIK